METAEIKAQRKTNPNREKLLIMSNDAKALKERMIQESQDVNDQFWWAAQSVNSILLKYFHKVPEDLELGTFHQWKAKGCMIKKGEKALVIWGQPLGAQRAEKAKAKGEPEPDEDGAGDYFPMCFLFTANQVLTPEQLEEEKRLKLEAREKKEQIKEAIKNLESVDMDLVL